MAISLEERDRRYRAIQELMKKDKLDSLVVAGRGDYMSRGNIRYITNYGTIIGEQYCIFPAQGAPIFIARNTPFLVTLRRAGWVPDIREASNPLEKIKQELSRFDQGNQVGVVGIGDISVPVYLAIERQFPGRLLDATGIFEQLRIIKSPEEIEKMRISASIADKVFSVLKDMIRPGLSDYEIYGEVKRIIHEMGCEYSMEIINTEGAKINLFYPEGYRLEANGTLAMEITPSYEGYYTQLPVTLPVVEYPSHLQKLIPVWEQAMEAALNMLRPGTKVSDIYHTIMNVINGRGYLSPWRCGHGIGLDVIDFWGVVESNTAILKSGMTLVLHPCVLPEPEGDGIGMGYTYLITDTGSEKLNKVDIVN